MPEVSTSSTTGALPEPVEGRIVVSIRSDHKRHEP